VTAYRKSSHSVYQLHYHFVFSTKYRKPALRGTVGEKVRELIRELVATGEHGYQIHRRHRSPGTHPVARGRFFALAVPWRHANELELAGASRTGGRA
jgi:hypothetical protein